MSPAGQVTWGIGCWQSDDLGALVSDVKASEDAGFSYFWYGNEKLHPDMWIGLTAAALNSSTINVGTFIADPFSIHPAVTAAMVATLDHYSGGRAVLLLGAGGSGLRELGIERKKPVDAIEAAADIARRLFRGEMVDREIPIPAHAKLHFDARPSLPIWIASRGTRTLELAGRVADGVMIGTLARAEDIRWAIHRVQAGAESAGRNLAELTLSVRVDVVVNDDRSIARDALRPFVADVLSASYPDRGFIERAGIELPEELEAVSRTKDLRLAWASGHLVPDEVVDTLTWAGTPNDVAGHIAAAIDEGAQNVTVVFHRSAGTTATQLRAFAKSVIPRVNALFSADQLHAQGVV